MKRIIVFFLITCWIGSFGMGADFDWIRLHERADTMTLPEAEAQIDQNTALPAELYTLALAYLTAHEDEKAEKIFQKLYGLNPQDIPARWGIAECLRRGHRYGESERILKEVIAQDPQFAPAYISLGYIRYMQMEFEETVRLTATVLRLGEQKVNSMNMANAHGLYAGAKGMIAHYGGPLSKAVNGAAVLPHLKAAEKIKPDSVSVLYGMGSYYMLIPPVLGRDIDKGIEYLEKAIVKDPRFPDIYARLAQAYRAKGDLAKYEEYITKALTLDPQNEIALDVQAGTCKFVCF
ncbi:MAG: tetratricopeptide repeat protein [Candidatus Omnitrophica bacterium]|nr:tetratricopeptide repeat protein [Candidatus Omnitrophota bacterium]